MTTKVPCTIGHAPDDVSNVVVDFVASLQTARVHLPCKLRSAPTSGGSARESASPPSSASIFPVASLQTAHEPSPATFNYAPVQVARRPLGARDLVLFLRYVDWLQTTKGQSLPLTKEEQGIRMAFNRNRILPSFVFPSWPLWLKGSHANAPDKKQKKRRGLRNH